MDVREKLVELLREAPYNIFGNKLGNCYFDSCLELIADHLITNGVTVQEWISVKDRLPEESGLYITFGCTAAPARWLHNFDKDMGKFGVWWDYDTDGKKHPRYRFIEAEDITHWMPLPSTEGLAVQALQGVK